MTQTDPDQTLISLLFNPKKWKKQTQEATVAAPFKIKKYLWVFPLLALLVFIVYFNSLNNGLVSDDKGLATEGANLTKLSYIFTDPLSIIRSIIYAVLYQINGSDPLLFRLLNIFFHLGNTWLVFMIVSLLLKPRIGIITATIFAVHPILTESVTWISGGPYSQYSFFFLLAFLLYVLFSRSNKGKYYWLSLAVFLVGLLSSNRVLTLVLIFPLYDWVFLHKINWKRLAPYFMLSIFWGLVYVIQIGGRSSSLIEMNFSSAGNYNLFLLVPYALTTYLKLIFYPVKLTFYHSDLVVTGGWLLEKWTGVLLLSLGLLITYKTNRKLFFWLTFFVISLMITLTPFKIAQIASERYVYLGSLGIFVVVAWVLDWLLGQKSIKFILPRNNLRVNYLQANITIIMIITIIIGLGIRTMVRNQDWKDSDTLMLATIQTSPESPRAQNNVGAYYYKQGDYPRAIDHFQKTLQINPRFLDAYQNLVITYMKIGEKAKAIEVVNQGLRVNPNSQLLLTLKAELDGVKIRS